MSQLPIDKTTLVVGSCDGGLTVVNSHATVAGHMAAMGRGLNLKGHFAGSAAERSQFLHTPLDLEGHVGHDGKFYLCDFSRLMPPEMPRRDCKQAYLYQLLRREYVAALEEPLCSDAYSQFTKVGRSMDTNDALSFFSVCPSRRYMSLTKRTTKTSSAQLVCCSSLSFRAWRLI